MNRTELVKVIAGCLKELSPAMKGAADMGEETPVFGQRGPLDSMQLVTFLMELEQQINDRCGTMISIADDRALSQQRSPFRSVGTLADYVDMLLTEQQQTS